LSQEQFGKKVGISKRMIAHYESSRGDPSIETLRLLASALSVSVSYLTGESAQKSIKDELSPKLRRHIHKFQKLPPKDQKAVMRMVDALAAQSNISDADNDTSEEDRST
jgi:transcriptional regulator with XRE-family HTH domain